MEEQHMKTLISSKFDKTLNEIHYTYHEKRNLEVHCHKFTFGYRNKSYSLMIIRRLNKTVYHYQDNDSDNGHVEDVYVDQKFKSLLLALQKKG
jgi:hypothetical protein